MNRTDAGGGSIEGPAPTKPKCPQGFVLVRRREGDVLSVEFRRSARTAGWSVVYLVVFTLFFMASMSSATRSPFGVFVVAQIGVAVWLSYSALVKLINRQRVVFGGGRMVSKSGPIPVPGNGMHALDEIVGFSVQYFHRKLYFRGPSERGYKLRAEKADGVTYDLAFETSNRDEAEYACHVLDEALQEAREPNAGGLYRGVMPRIGTSCDGVAQSATDAVSEDLRISRKL